MYGWSERQGYITWLEVMRHTTATDFRHHSIAISGRSATICYTILSRATADTSSKNAPDNRYLRGFHETDERHKNFRRDCGSGRLGGRGPLDRRRRLFPQLSRPAGL